MDLEKIRAAAERVARSEGLEVVDVEWKIGKQRFLRVYIDRVAIEDAIKQLPPRCKMMFVLYDIQGYAHGEIAKLLGCSVGNAKSQLHKARVRLRKLLRPEVSANDLRKGASGSPAELNSRPFLPSTELCETM